jgi:hypothetical protein
LALLEAQRLVGEAGIRGKALFGKIGIFHDFVIDKYCAAFGLAFDSTLKAILCPPVPAP